MRPPPKLTRQGVPDLGGNARKRAPRIVAGCSHLWEPVVVYDCMLGLSTTILRCGLCHAERR